MAGRLLERFIKKLDGEGGELRNERTREKDREGKESRREEKGRGGKAQPKGGAWFSVCLYKPRWLVRVCRVLKYVKASLELARLVSCCG